LPERFSRIPPKKGPREFQTAVK